MPDRRPPQQRVRLMQSTEQQGASSNVPSVSSCGSRRGPRCRSLRHLTRNLAPSATRFGVAAEGGRARSCREGQAWRWWWSACRSSWTCLAWRARRAPDTRASCPWHERAPPNHCERQSPDRREATDRCERQSPHQCSKPTRSAACSALGATPLLRNGRRRCRARHDPRSHGRGYCSSGASRQSLLVLDELQSDARLLGLLRLIRCCRLGSCGSRSVSVPGGPLRVLAFLSGGRRVFPLTV